MSVIAPTVFDQAALPDGLQRGLGTIRDTLVPTARVVAVQDNFALIAIGTMDGEEITALYTQETVSLFVRVPLSFPQAEPYGILTDALLTRRDGRAIDRQHANHANAQPLAQLLGHGNVGFWSWNWTGMPLHRPEDLVAIVEWARKRIREG